jgi:fructokinase
MSGSTVLCLGEALLDCLADQPTLSVQDVQSWTSYPGGAPANVACALQKLGTPAAFIGCVGDDEMGIDLNQFFQKMGINTAGIQRHPIAPTRQVYVLRDLTGDRQFSGFSHPDPTAFADAHLNADQLLRSLFEAAEYLVLGTIGLAYPETRAAVTQAITWANEYYLKVIVDLNWRPRFWPQPHLAPALILPLLAEIDILKLSQEEAEWLFKTDDPQAIAAQLPDLEGVLLTRGAQGCTYCFHDQVGEVPAFAVQAVDTTGAGDSFLAGFIHQLHQHGISSLQDATSVQHMVRYASAVGAITTLNPGAITAQPTPETVEAFLLAHGH